MVIGCGRKVGEQAMPEERDTIIVFTARSPERIVREGGSQAWVLNPARAKLCKWLVCTQNRHNPDHNFSDATEAHGAAFMVAKISGISDKTDHGPGGRWKILISEYALIQMPDVWGHERNPVRYSSLEDLGIDPKGLEFTPMPFDADITNRSPAEPTQSPSLTIEDAKKMLAATFGVRPEAIEITIRG
jgi:hypothetical protein